METLWFMIVAFMVAMYVVLDGFDLGAGIIHLFVARNRAERRTILSAIGPVWDGNEVWLLAAGGTLFFAFPQLYASSFSGFYLPLIMVLWLLILRALGIEFQHQIHHPLWKTFWDGAFSAASILLAVFFGAALGNVVRGVPIDADRYFFEPLWTTFTVVPSAGILDWFTVLMGVVAYSTLLTHGANYISLKTEGDLQRRARRAASWGWYALVATSLLALIATSSIRPEIWDNYGTFVWGWIFPLIGLGGTIGMFVFNRRGDDLKSFLSSSAFIIGMLASTAFAAYPVLLKSSLDPAFSLTVANAKAQDYGLSVGFVWWILGLLLTAGYFIFVYRSFRGKVTVSGENGY
ncbi:MAG: cytochrome d ubiquinol oxidase subunit II [Proteobacteria bacterium]|nr:cytochrome d ubiquinol oxidase subunit II [Pseudomonadota bacterium]